MLNFDNWRNGTAETKESDGASHLSVLRDDRLRSIDNIVTDLADFGIAQSYTNNQIRGALLGLFETFPTEWFLYIFVGSELIKDAITNDATLPWLDLDANGQTIRTRLVNRL